MMSLSHKCVITQRLRGHACMLKLLPERWEKAWVKALGAADACDAVRFQDVLSTLLADEPAAGVLLTLSRHCAKAADPFQQYRVTPFRLAVALGSEDSAAQLAQRGEGSRWLSAAPAAHGVFLAKGVTLNSALASSACRDACDDIIDEFVPSRLVLPAVVSCADGALAHATAIRLLLELGRRRLFRGGAIVCDVRHCASVSTADAARELSMEMRLGGALPPAESLERWQQTAPPAPVVAVFLCDGREWVPALLPLHRGVIHVVAAVPGRAPCSEIRRCTKLFEVKAALGPEPPDGLAGPEGPGPELARLRAFPGAFDASGAAVVLGCTVGAAQALLNSLAQAGRVSTAITTLPNFCRFFLPKGGADDVPSFSAAAVQHCCRYFSPEGSAAVSGALLEWMDTDADSILHGVLPLLLSAPEQPRDVQHALAEFVGFGWQYLVSRSVSVDVVKQARASIAAARS